MCHAVTPLQDGTDPGRPARARLAVSALFRRVEANGEEDVPHGRE
jgi:hypothetical protein